MHTGGAASRLSGVLVVQDRYYVTREYMKEVLEHMSIAQLIDTILINPTVHLSPSYRDTGLSASYTFKPLSNLVYTRDQQVLYVGYPLQPCYKQCQNVSSPVRFMDCMGSHILPSFYSLATWHCSSQYLGLCQWFARCLTCHETVCADYDMQGNCDGPLAQRAKTAGG